MIRIALYTALHIQMLSLNFQLSIGKINQPPEFQDFFNKRNVFLNLFY